MITLKEKMMFIHEKGFKEFYMSKIHDKID